MTELRLLGLSEDGRHLVLAGPDGSDLGALRLPIDERLRAALRGDRARLGQLEITLESALTPREIQRRIRAGESAEDVARAAGVPVDRVQRFERPVLDERAHIVRAAQATAAWRDGIDHPLGELVVEALEALDVDPATVLWDSWRGEDGAWTVQLSYRQRGGPAGGAAERTAAWTFEPDRQQLAPADDLAARLLEGAPPRPAAEAPEVAREEERSLRVVQPLAERRTGATDRAAEADGVRPGSRATVPSWDDILFGTRRPDA